MSAPLLQMLQPDEHPPNIRQLGYSARESLAIAAELVRREAVPISDGKVEGVKWHLFLDFPTDVIETCAVSCGLLALESAGEDQKSELIKRAVTTLLRLEHPGGGWTSWITALNEPPDEIEESLVIDTFFALQALRTAGQEQSEAFSRGIEWFRQAKNPTEGAWGFYANAHCHTLPTSMALRILAPIAPINPLVGDVVKTGEDWLGKVQRENSDGGWGRAPGEPSSAVHTAWALMALAALGYDAYSHVIVSGRSWLLEHSRDREHVSDLYHTPGSRRSITHISFAEGLVLQGCLAAGTNILDPRLLDLVRDLISKQKNGSWRCLGTARDQPIFAITDACLGLRTFSDLVQTHEAVLEVSERIQEHDSQLNGVAASVAAVAGKTDAALAALQAIQQQIGLLSDAQQKLSAGVETLKSSQGSTLAAIDQLHSGLAFLRPAMWFTRKTTKHPWLVLLAVLSLSAYTLSAVQVSKPNTALSLIAGILLSLAFVASIYFSVYRKPAETNRDR